MAGKWMSPVAAVSSTQVIKTGSQFGHGMILDIFEYDIKALCISYNELDNGAVHTRIASHRGPLNRCGLQD